MEFEAYTDKLREHCDKNFAELRTGQRWTIGLLIATFAGLATMILNIT